MPDLKIEYAKSGRSKCTGPGCKSFIVAGELRMGTATKMPGADDVSFKWRHIPCFSKRQLQNCRSVDNIDGYDDLPQHHQAIVQRMVRGEFAGNMSLVGKFLSNEARQQEAAKVEKEAERDAKGKKKGTALHQQLMARARHDRDEEDGDGYGDSAIGATMRARVYVLEKRNKQLLQALEDSGAEVPEPDAEVLKLLNDIKQKRAADKKQMEVMKEIAVVPVAVAAGGAGAAGGGGGGAVKEGRCPYGKNCFRRHDPKHSKEFSHDSDEEDIFRTGTKKQPQPGDQKKPRFNLNLDNNDDDDDGSETDEYELPSEAGSTQEDDDAAVDPDNLDDVFGFSVNSPKPPQPPKGAAAAVAAAGGKKEKIPCPLGSTCNRTAREHFDQYSHPGDDAADDLIFGGGAAAAAALPPVVTSPGGKGKKAGPRAGVAKTKAVMLQQRLNFGQQGNNADPFAPAVPAANFGDVPMCPHGALCFNNSVEHRTQYKH